MSKRNYSETIILLGWTGAVLLLNLLCLSVGLSVDQSITLYFLAFMSGFWAAAPKGTKSCRTQGDFRSSIHPSVPQALPGLESVLSGLKSTFSGLKSAFSGLKSALSGLQSALSGLKSPFLDLKSASLNLPSRT